MFQNFAKKVFGSRNQRLVKQYSKIATRITALEPEFEALSDAELQAKTPEFRQRLADGATLEDLLPEAFATVREAGKRVLEMRHFDVQLIGAMVLNDGNIAEMRTGEGKTLVSTLAAYLNALTGDGVHVVTVNEYLASRDAAWMGRLHQFLGLTVGVVASGQSSADKRENYACDITYGTNNEFGFDYLRDNMAFHNEDRVQRGLNYAIIDEVDSILIDEARTPLIISGPADDDTSNYAIINKVVPALQRAADEESEGDFVVDEKGKNVHLTEAGNEHAEELLTKAGLLPEGESLYDSANVMLVHHLGAALRAQHLYRRDDHYIVRNGEIVIVDEFTGRVMPGRRWSEGLHQAVEAKEGVKVQQENQTLASITFQNLFRMYNKLSGMTGTADTEAFEFQQIYALEVVVVPTNRDMVRDDQGDLVFLSALEKYEALADDIDECQKRHQPVLVGTTSIENSELLSQLLTKRGVKHEVLNAKQHEREADIIAQAGRPDAVTIATNMAGRGTDIVLGGNWEVELEKLPEAERENAAANIKAEWQKRHDLVKESGGLHVIGTERHESRRVDNQLRGRAGRQGDPGSSRFYLSLEDPLMRIFASPRMASMMQRLGMEEGEAIEHRWVSRAIENAQRKVESHNFDIRKNLLEYDDVANDQRQVIYNQRAELLADDDVQEVVTAIRADVVAMVVGRYIPLGSIPEQWDLEGLQRALQSELGLEIDLAAWAAEQKSPDNPDFQAVIHDKLLESYKAKEELASPEVIRQFEKSIVLQVLDKVWKEHLAAMDYLRQGIHLRGYAQKNPKQEYKREAFTMFERMLDTLRIEAVSILSKVQVRAQSDVDAAEERRRREAAALANAENVHQSAPTSGADSVGEGTAPASAGVASPLPRPQGRPAQPRQVASPQSTFVRQQAKVGRNDPCPCGSGKKYKQCHGKVG